MHCEICNVKPIWIITVRICVLLLTDGSFSGSFPGFSVVDVPLDGQCAFSAISHQLVARNYVSCDVSGDIVRRDVVDFLSANEELKAVISERLSDQTLDDYITAMRHASTWADENMLYVASVLYDVEINVLRCDAGVPVCIGSSTTNRSLYLGYVACIGDSSPTHYVSQPSLITNHHYRHRHNHHQQRQITIIIITIVIIIITIIIIIITSGRLLLSSSPSSSSSSSSQHTTPSPLVSQFIHMAEGWFLVNNTLT